MKSIYSLFLIGMLGVGLIGWSCVSALYLEYDVLSVFVGSVIGFISAVGFGYITGKLTP